MAFDWGYFFSLFSIGAFWQACVTVIVISTLSGDRPRWSVFC